MHLPTQQTTLKVCNLNWPKYLERDSWQNGRSLCGALIRHSALKQEITNARVKKYRIRWHDYTVSYVMRNTNELQAFYTANVVGLVTCLDKVEEMATELARHSKPDDATALKAVAGSAALLKARYQWLPGNSYLNHWAYPRAALPRGGAMPVGLDAREPG